MNNIHEDKFFYLLLLFFNLCQFLNGTREFDDFSKRITFGRNSKQGAEYKPVNIGKDTATYKLSYSEVKWMKTANLSLLKHRNPTSTLRLLICGLPHDCLPQ
jgi:hypothetical protein